MLELVEAIEKDLRDQLAVRRQDIEELTATVEQLVEAQRLSEKRLGRLETAVVQLTEAQRRTEQRVKELAEAQRRTEQRVEELAEAQRRTEQRLDRLEAVVAQLAEAQRRTEQRVEELAEAQRRTEEQIQKLIKTQQDFEKRLRRVENKLSDIDGRTLEARYRERATSYFGPLLRRLRVVDPYTLEDEMETSLSSEEFYDLLLLDLLLQGRLRRQPEAPEVWLAVEISAVVDRRDVTRARRRADLLRKAGYRAIPVVAGQDITRGAETEAEVQKVAVLQDGQVLLWKEALAVLGIE